MKNSILFLVTLTLCACTKPVFYPYEGTKTISGNGGFQEGNVKATKLSNSFFDKKHGYKYDGVTFYHSGLPTGTKCRLIGYFAGSNSQEIAKNTLKLNGNIATKSSVSFPVKFDKDAGFLDGTGNASDWYNSYGDKIAKGYNIFECTE